MTWQDLWGAVALLLVFEGIMPFMNPTRLKKTLLSVVAMEDRRLRTLGFLSMLSGISLIYFIY
jgi:uncharacterized protein YjeT (DUF2065 family)